MMMMWEIMYMRLNNQMSTCVLRHAHFIKIRHNLA